MNVDPFETVSDDDHQTKVVPRNIKNRVRRSVIRAVKVLPYVVEISKIRVFHQGMPFTQHALSRRMLLPKLSKHSNGDNVHG